MSRVLSKVICCDDEENSCTFTISNGGDVYVIGGENDNNGVPKLISLLKDITALDCGAHHTICIDSNGEVFGFGSNTYGQLGIGKDRDMVEYEEIQKIRIPLVKQVSCGGYYTICLTYDGELFSFGDNHFGQLGHGDDINCSFPKRITTITDVEYVQNGYRHSIAIKNNTEVYVWGYNINGQLGLGHTNDQWKPFRNTNFPDNVIDIKCGEEHTLILTLDQEVFSCGYNYSGELGRDLNDTTLYSPILGKIDISGIIRIDCGIYHSMCVDIHNNLFLFGCNTNGQLGLGDAADRQAPVKHPSLSNIVDISSKGRHVFVKTSINEIYAFGYNNFSQIGINTKNESQLEPIQVLKDREFIWYSNNWSRVKSARK